MKVNRRAITPFISIILLISFIGGLVINMQYISWELFAISTFGVSMSVLGIITSLGELGYSLIHPLTGKLSDIRGRKIILALSSIFFIIGASMLAIVFNFIFLIPAVIIFRIGSAIFDPGFYAAVDESVLAERRGRGFGLNFSMRVGGGVLAGILAGLIGLNLGYPILFVVIDGISAILLLVVILFKPVNNQSTDTVSTVNSVSKAKIDGDNRIRLRIYVIGAMDAFSWATFYPIFTGMLNIHLHLNLLQIGFANSLQLLLMMIILPLFGLFSDRYGRKKFFILSEGLGVFTILGFLFSTNYTSILLLQLPMAAVGATYVVSFYPLLMDNTPYTRRAEIIGWATAIRGLTAFPAPFIGGLIFDILGYEATLLTSTILVVLTLSLIFSLLPGRAVN
ncbi:MAG: MFS transporter [Candidatus Odinarchaeota archaeon]